MKKSQYILVLICFILSACAPDRVTETPALLQVTTATQSKRAPAGDHTSTLPPATSIRVPNIPTKTPGPSPLPVATAFPTMGPIVHRQSGELYETVFRIPVGSDSVIQYQELPGAILGPNALAIQSDDTFIISDHTTHENRLLYFDREGSLIRSIDLDGLGISYVTDMRIRGDIVLLLELTYHGSYKIHQLSQDGSIVSSEDIPEKFPSSSGKRLAAGEVNIAIDCEMNVLMVLEGGYKVYRFTDVLITPNLLKLQEGFPCNGRYYRVIDSQGSISRIDAGGVIYETLLTSGFGGLTFLDVFVDGSIYVVRNDVVNEQVIEVDQTIHFLSDDGATRGVARVPLSEYYYPSLEMPQSVPPVKFMHYYHALIR